MRYEFEIQTRMKLSIDRADKFIARAEVLKDLEEGKYDEELRKFATVSIGKKEVKSKWMKYFTLSFICVQLY